MVLVDIYGRVSTIEQAEGGYSLQEQENRLRLYAEAQGWIVHDCLMDGGFSGASLDRPGIQKVISDATHGRIHKVLVYKLDRLSRSQKDTMHLIEDVFIKNGIDFVSQTESIDTSSPVGMAMVGVLSVFAQLERENIKSRMMLGRDARVRSGKYHGNAHDVIGYNYDKQGGLIHNEYDAMMVRNIFSMFVSGISESEIARRVTAQGWRGHEWTASKMNRILNQPLYIGLQRWKGETVRVENCVPIISDDVWEAKERVRALRTRKMPNPQTSGRHVTMLGGLLWCGCCGKRYNGVKSTEWGGGSTYRYYCYSRVRRSHHLQAPDCDNIGWRSDVLDPLILAEIRKLRADSGFNPQGGISERENSINAVKAQITVLEGQMERLVSLYALGSISTEAINTRAQAIKKEKDSLESRLTELEKPSLTLKESDVDRLLSNFDALVDAADEDGLYTLTHQLIQSIVLTGDEVRINWNFDI